MPTVHMCLILSFLFIGVALLHWCLRLLEVCFANWLVVLLVYTFFIIVLVFVALQSSQRNTVIVLIMMVQV